MKYYLIPAEEIEKLEQERKHIYDVLDSFLTEKQKVSFPFASLTNQMWNITQRRWEEESWISVDTELPDDKEEVLVMQNPETTSTKRALFAVFDADTKKFLVLGFSHDGIHMSRAYWSDIIKWRHLPKI